LRLSNKYGLKAPGLKLRGKNDERLYWICRDDIARAGFTPRQVRLHYNIQNSADHRLIEAACQRFDAEMKMWSSDIKTDAPHFDGTIQSLSRRYQTDQESPFKKHKWNWRDRETRILKIIEKAFGGRSLSALRNTDFQRWYDAAKQPKTPGGPERIDRAVKIMKLVRQMVHYGVQAELPQSDRLSRILDKMRFQGPERRRVTLDLEHVKAFIPKAVEMGRLSLALGTAIQFETMMRQKDVIGEWEPLGDSNPSHGIVLGRARWVKGLTWADIPESMVIRKVTTKTGAIVVADLKLCPLVLDVLQLIPVEKRIGPLIIDENAGRPYAEDAYTREWRKVARAASIPDRIRNMDARAGAITEADDAQAPLDDIRSSAGHSQASTTVRYVRGSAGKSKHVAELRLLHRARKQDENGN
jgi:hypothetical protein